MAPGQAGQPASGAVRDWTPRDVKKSSGETAPGRRSHELSPQATALESHLGAGGGGRVCLACRSGACHGGTRTSSWSQWGCEVVTVHSLRDKPCSLFSVKEVDSQRES